MFQTAPFVLSGGEVKLLFINPFVRSNNSGTLRMPQLTGPLRRGPGGAQRYRARNDRGARRLSTTSRLRLRAPPRHNTASALQDLGEGAGTVTTQQAGEQAWTPRAHKGKRPVHP